MNIRNFLPYAGILFCAAATAYMYTNHVRFMHNWLEYLWYALVIYMAVKAYRMIPPLSTARVIVPIIVLLLMSGLIYSQTMELIFAPGRLWKHHVDAGDMHIKAYQSSGLMASSSVEAEIYQKLEYMPFLGKQVGKASFNRGSLHETNTCTLFGQSIIFNGDTSAVWPIGK